MLIHSKRQKKREILQDKGYYWATFIYSYGQGLQQGAKGGIAKTEISDYRGPVKISLTENFYTYKLQKLQFLTYDV